MEDRERVLLVGVDTGEEVDFERNMEELGELAKACYMQVVGVITQKLDQVNKALYVGSGKVREILECAEKVGAQLVIFDDALSPSQLRNLQDALQLPILDRTTLILDIFALRAQTKEAKLQVETARLQYLLPRLVGMHDALSRQGGGSGSLSNKGSGEKKLELDRRKIEHRISAQDTVDALLSSDKPQDIDTAHASLVQETRFERMTGEVTSEFVPVRPIPDAELWFETVYNRRNT